MFEISTASPRRGASPLLKRLFDIVLSAVGLALTSPLFVAIAIIIKIGSKGAVFYRGLRIGRDGKPFRMFKFRTMVPNADQIGGPSTAGNDPRLTRIGRWLRRYKLDELPQLINVLVGDMSFVGPRPEVAFYVDMYTEEERRLLVVRPGITDRASLRFSNEAEILEGHDDPEDAYMRLIRPEKIRLGLEYVDNWSLREDFRIMRQTVSKIISSR